MCFTFQVKINSRGLVYSVVLLLGSVALTVSFYHLQMGAPCTLHFIQLSLAGHVSLLLALQGEGQAKDMYILKDTPKSNCNHHGTSS